MSFVVKDETRPLEPVWRIQSNLKDDKIRFEFHNCILEFAPQLAATHIDYLINDLKVCSFQPYFVYDSLSAFSIFPITDQVTLVAE